MRHPFQERAFLAMFCIWTLLMSHMGCDNAPAPAPATTGKQPTPSLSPAEVVKIQLEALKSNGADDDGIVIDGLSTTWIAGVNGGWPEAYGPQRVGAHLERSSA